MQDNTQATQNKQSENPVIDSLMQQRAVEHPVNQEVESQSAENINTDDQDESSLELNSGTEESTNESESSNAADSGQADEQSSAEGEDPDKKPWWEDESPSTEVVEDLGQVNYETLSKSLGIEGKDLNEIKSSIEKLKSERDEAHASLSKISEKSPYANEEIQKANELAQSGGDWKTFLQISETNYDLIDDQTLLVELELKPAFNGDAEEVQKYLESVNPSDIKLKGSKIRAELKAQQQAEKQRLFAEAAAKKQKLDNSIKESLDKTDSLYGVKLTPSKRKDMFNDITSQNFLNSIFFDKDGNVNPKGMVEAAFLIKNIKEIMNVNMTKFKNQGVKEVLNERTNTKLRTNGNMANPKIEEKGSPLDGLMANLKQNGPQ
jgi:hypothetical protein